MSYIKANLLAGEEVVYEGKLSVMSHWKIFLVALIFLYAAVQSGEYALLLVSVIAILSVIIACLTSEFASLVSPRVTTKRQARGRMPGSVFACSWPTGRLFFLYTSNYPTCKQTYPDIKGRPDYSKGRNEPASE